MLISISCNEDFSTILHLNIKLFHVLAKQEHSVNLIACFSPVVGLRRNGNFALSSLALTLRIIFSRLTSKCENSKSPYLISPENNEGTLKLQHWWQEVNTYSHPTKFTEHVLQT